MSSKGSSASGGNSRIKITPSPSEDTKGEGRDLPVEAIKKGLEEFIKLLTDTEQADAVLFLAVGNDGWSKGEFWTKDNANIETIAATVKDILAAMDSSDELVH